MAEQRSNKHVITGIAGKAGFDIIRYFHQYWQLYAMLLLPFSSLVCSGIIMIWASSWKNVRTLMRSNLQVESKNRIPTVSEYTGRI